MRISEKGLALIKSFEGCKLEAYQCSAGVWTVGFGHTGPEVERGVVITADEAEMFLERDLAKFEKCVEGMLLVKVTQGQFDALVSFAFNLGCGALKGSTLLRLMNQEKPEEAALQFARWNKAGGKELAGLTRRRQAEAELFLS